METLTWQNFTEVFEFRREGNKDGCCFAPATFTPEPDGRHVRRLKRNLVARTAVALDLETNKDTGEVTPQIGEVVRCIEAIGWAAVIYTSHNHRPEAPRFRVILPITAEIAPDLPAPEVIAERLGLRGVLDTSKLQASSVFYLPSAEPEELDHHETLVLDGSPIDATWVREAAGAILAAREDEA